MDPRISSALPPSLPAAFEASRPSGPTFRHHLADGLATASRVADAVGTVVPGAGLVGVALSGLSHLVGGPESGAETMDLSRVLAETRTLNGQYLLLQQQMQRESRMFTAISNIMRVRHEAAKNALANIR